MTENKKQEISKEENKKIERKLPQFHFGYLGNSYIQTEKGMYQWLCPLGISWDDSIKWLEYTIEETKKLKAAAIKKQEELEKEKEKVDEKKREEYKPVA
jgi:hypothetical protein